MQEWADLIVKLGVLPAIIGYLLFDYSKRFEGIRLEQAKRNEEEIKQLNTLDGIKDELKEIKDSLLVLKENQNGKRN